MFFFYLNPHGMTDTYCMVPVHTQVEGKEQNIATYLIMVLISISE